MTLKEMRAAAGLSQSQLAGTSGVSVRLIQEYEQSARDINGAKLKTLLSLAEALNCSLEEILTDEELKQQVRRYECRISCRE